MALLTHNSRSGDRFRSRGWRLCCLLLGLWIASRSAFPVQAQPSRAREYQVKTAYLFNFAKYVEWPPRAFSSPDAPVEIGVLGADPFGDLLEKVIGSRLVGSRKVLVRRSRRVEDLRQCHILFISNSERERAGAIFESLKGTFALTVTEFPETFVSGGIITFVIENGVVRFDLNLDEAENAGLKISARMANTARIVYSRKRNNPKTP